MNRDRMPGGLSHRLKIWAEWGTNFLSIEVFESPNRGVLQSFFCFTERTCRRTANDMDFAFINSRSHVVKTSLAVYSRSWLPIAPGKQRMRGRQ